MANEISIRKLQSLIRSIDYNKNAIDKYFYKLIEEIGELAKVVNSNSRLKENGDIKNTIEEELHDVLYYVICLANVYGIDLEECIYLKEQINAQKYRRKSIFE